MPCMKRNKNGIPQPPANYTGLMQDRRATPEEFADGYNQDTGGHMIVVTGELLKKLIEMEERQNDSSRTAGS